MNNLYSIFFSGKKGEPQYLSFNNIHNTESINKSLAVSIMKQNTPVILIIFNNYSQYFRQKMKIT